MALFDLKTLNSALDELQAEKGISRDSVVEAIATALAAAYRRRGVRSCGVIDGLPDWP